MQFPHGSDAEYGGYGLGFGFKEHAGYDGEDGYCYLDDFAPGFAIDFVFVF